MQTPAQEALHQEALALAQSLFAGDAPAGGRSVGTSVNGTLSRAQRLSVSRQEAYLNKQAALRAWDFSSSPSLTERAASTSLQGASRGRNLLQDEGSSQGAIPPPPPDLPPAEDASPPPAPSPPPPPSRSPRKPTPTPTPTPTLTGNAKKYATVLGLSWKYYKAQRSGSIPPGYPVQWRKSSHLSDKVVGGWYDAGDFLKLNFPLAPTVSMLAWGMLEFNSSYVASGELKGARAALRVAVDYLYRSYSSAKGGTYVGQIGDPDIDHNYWGRPEQQRTKRPAYVYDNSMAASDLLGGVAAALASSSLVFKSTDPPYATKLLKAAKSLSAKADARPGRYSDYYKKQTASIYPSSDYWDAQAWASCWLFQATGDRAYLKKVAKAWDAASGRDIYPGWDSQWAPVALFMLNLHAKGTRAIPNQDKYRAFWYNQFMKAWTRADGYLDIVKTPKGLVYPSWNEWANLQMSTTAAFMMTLHAKWSPYANTKTQALKFAKNQIDYALGSSGRSFVVGYGTNPPKFAHHAAASCPNMPASCGEAQFRSKKPNPQILYGALVGGPRGQRVSKNNPDNTYTDKRNDYVSNEVANDYNAGFTGALAGLMFHLR